LKITTKPLQMVTIDSLWKVASAYTTTLSPTPVRLAV